MSELSSIRVEQHSITTRDKTALMATLYRPVEANQCAVLIAPAMGVKQSYYRHYATFLAEQGFVTLTFDYRGVGQSLKGKLWGYDASLLQWGVQDMQAMLAWLLRQYPNYELRVVGHSIGTKLLGLSRSSHRVTGLLGISSANIYWQLFPLYIQPLLLLLWYILLPISTYAMGYFPANFFGLGEKLPKDLGFDWARMARSRYSVLTMYGGTEDDHYADFTGNLILHTFSDDHMLTERAADELLDYYPNAQNKQHHRINPVDVGQKAIGHLSFFRPTMRDSLWQETAAWLLDPQIQTVIPEPLAVRTLQAKEIPHLADI
jgi:predicted alpha/beta hydrolase